MPHEHPSHESHHEETAGIKRHIHGISLANLVIGCGEIVGGALTGSATLSMAGAHDLADSGLYHLKARAAGEADPAKRRRMRRLGASALIAITSMFGIGELVHHVVSDEKPEDSSLIAGVASATANIVAAATLHKHKNHEHAHDTRMHVLKVDLPAALVTLVAVPAATRFPEVDVLGTFTIMGLAAQTGIDTLRDTAAEDHSHD